MLPFHSAVLLHSALPVSATAPDYNALQEGEDVFRRRWAYPLGRGKYTSGRQAQESRSVRFSLNSWSQLRDHEPFWSHPRFPFSGEYDGDTRNDRMAFQRKVKEDLDAAIEAASPLTK